MAVVVLVEVKAKTIATVVLVTAAILETAAAVVLIVAVALVIGHRLIVSANKIKPKQMRFLCCLFV